MEGCRLEGQNLQPKDVQRLMKKKIDGASCHNVQINWHPTSKAKKGEMLF